MGILFDLEELEIMKKKVTKFFNKIISAIIITIVLAATPAQSILASDTDIVNTIISVYNNLLGVYSDMLYQFDPQIPTYILNNQDIVNSNASIAAELRKSIDLETVSSFSGVKAQNQKEIWMANIKAGDDVDVNYANTNMFGVSEDMDKQLNDKEFQKNNAFFNVEYLIGADVYKDSFTKSNAMAYLERVKNNIPLPLVIRLGATFDVPINNPNDPTQKFITIGQKTPLSIKEVDNLRKELQNNQDYRDYKNKYRSLIAMRNMLLSNLQYSYLIRLPQASGKSIEQIRNDQVNNRLTSQYYERMSTASEAVISREILFVLSEINAQLNEIRKQNERTIIMNSVIGLSDQALFKVQSINGTVQRIGQLIYCKVPANKDETLCNKSTTNQESTGVTAPGDLLNNVPPSI